jgi:hypothetical protein
MQGIAFYTHSAENRVSVDFGRPIAALAWEAETWGNIPPCHMCGAPVKEHSMFRTGHCIDVWCCYCGHHWTEAWRHARQAEVGFKRVVERWTIND